MLRKNILTFIIFLFCLGHGLAQEIGFMLFNGSNKNIKKSELISAANLSEIKDGFPTSWIEKYFSIGIATSATDGKEAVISESNHETLSTDQRKFLTETEIGSDIEFEIIYAPITPVEPNEKRTINFSFTVAPEKDAMFIGGMDAMKEYITKTIFQKISTAEKEQFPKAVFSFIINVDGMATKVKMIESSGSIRIDQLISEAVLSMSKWNAASDMNANKVEQNFLLHIGNMIGC